MTTHHPSLFSLLKAFPGFCKKIAASFLLITHMFILAIRNLFAMPRLHRHKKLKTAAPGEWHWHSVYDAGIGKEVFFVD